MPSASDVFVAVDVETCDQHHCFPCAIAMVRVDGGVITQRVSHLVQQSAELFHPRNVDVHGIEAQHSARALPFPQVWQALAPTLRNAAFLCAHNAGFERAVLGKTLMRHHLPFPPQPVVCSMQLAKLVWQLDRLGLSDVCAHLGLELTQHHNPLADAEACAQIMLRAMHAPTFAAVAAQAARSGKSGISAAAAPFLFPLRD